jgi:hypothetical protein
MTDADVTAAARKMLKTTKIADIQAELAKLDQVTMLNGEQMDQYYTCRRAMRLAAK